MLKDWFNSLVAASVLIILICASGNAVMGCGFDGLSVASAVSLLMMLPILRKVASPGVTRRPKRK